MGTNFKIQTLVQVTNDEEFQDLFNFISKHPFTRPKVNAVITTDFVKHLLQTREPHVMVQFFESIELYTTIDTFMFLKNSRVDKR